MNICVVGAGIAGLSTALYLSKHPEVEVSVYEKSRFLGGRANVTDDGEHCPRVFLSDYECLFSILRDVPTADGRSLYESLRPLTRYCHTESAGWIETSHLYMILAKEIPLRERFRTFVANRRSPLVADQFAGANTNRYGSRKNFSFGTLLRLGVNLIGSKSAFALDGPTDDYLIEPWARYLEQNGVAIHRATPIHSIAPGELGVSVGTNDGLQSFDAAVVTAFAPDAAAILEASKIGHSIEALDHTHCKCLTVQLDPAESILAVNSGPAIYCRGGINAILQPHHARCVVICTRTPSTEDAYVLARLREMLGLEHDFASVKVRENQSPDEAVYCADYVDSVLVAEQESQRLYFAGSYVENSYPIDSGEGAARSALNAIERLRRDHGLAAPARRRTALVG